MPVIVLPALKLAAILAAKLAVHAKIVSTAAKLGGIFCILFSTYAITGSSLQVFGGVKRYKVQQLLVLFYFFRVM